MNNRGITFIELILYLALFTIVSLLIGKQFKVLVNNFSAGKRITRQQTDSRDILGLMTREIQNTGMKVYLAGSSGDYTKMVKPGVIVGTYLKDSSSFVHEQGNPYDALTIMKIHLDDNGGWDYTDTVKFYVEGTTLRRELRHTGYGTPTYSDVAKNVHALQFEFGILGADSLLLDEPNPGAGNWQISSSGYPSPNLSSGLNANISSQATSSGWIRCNSSFKITSKQMDQV
jgi:hypothetical protein